MSKGFLLAQILQFSSQCFKSQKVNLNVKANKAFFNLSLTNPSNKIQQSRYLPLAQNIQLTLSDSNQNQKLGYFNLPLTKLYQYPKRRHVIKVNCAWLDTKNNNEIISGDSATIKLAIIYMKDATAKLNIKIQKAFLQRDTQAIGKMDPFVECIVGNVTSKTQVKDEAGKQPIWQQTLPYTLQSIPQQIKFIVKDKDMTSDDIVGYASINPHEKIVFINDQNFKQWELQLKYKEQKAGKLFISTSFVIN